MRVRWHFKSVHFSGSHVTTVTYFLSSEDDTSVVFISLCISFVYLSSYHLYCLSKLSQKQSTYSGSKCPHVSLWLSSHRAAKSIKSSHFNKPQTDWAEWDPPVFDCVMKLHSLSGTCLFLCYVAYWNGWFPIVNIKAFNVDRFNRTELTCWTKKFKNKN